jgi:hypothetical protein
MQGMGVSADSLPETVLYTDFLQRVMAGPHLTRESLRMPCWPLMLQLSPLQEPCIVKAMSDESYPYKFG